jgi:hypothetical protein
MIPFCNKGWKYFDKFQDIMPGSTARGSHAFSPVTSAPPSMEFGDGDDEGGSGGASISCTEDTREELMDINKEVDNSTLILASITKRKLSTITSEEDTVTSTSASGQPQPLSTASSVPILQSSVALDEPSRKKPASVASSVGSSSKSHPKVPSSHHSKGPSSIHSSGHAGSLRTVTKLSSELIVHEVQGSISSLTSTVHDSMLTDQVTKVHQDALHLLQN